MRSKNLTLGAIELEGRSEERVLRPHAVSKSCDARNRSTRDSMSHLKYAALWRICEGAWVPHADAVARSRKKLAKRSSRRAAIRPGASGLTGAESLAERLTREILEIDRRSKTRVVEDVVAVGSRIKQLQQHLGFGRWLSWLSEHLPYSPRTAQRYVAVAQWSEAFPDDYAHFAPLGLGKLQQIATLTPSQRARFRRQRRFQIPGTNTRKTLALMTLEQLSSVIRGADALAARPQPVDPGKVLQRFRHRLAGLDALADQLRGAALPREDVEQAVDALEALLGEVRELL